MSDVQKKNLTTDELLKILHSVNSVSKLNEYTELLPENTSYHSFSEYFFAYLQTHNLVESEIIHASLIQRNYAYQILNGTKKPGRDKVLALCLAAHMTYEETQRALALAECGKLYPRRKKDSIIIFALENGLTVQQTNELLYEEGVNVLE
ncbi:MAG: XRE family transcriptional regulator [Tyzzerella sp.]|nr:XRE family transcriptional regulator [Tyzzerella sp.]